MFVKISKNKKVCKFRGRKFQTVNWPRPDTELINVPKRVESICDMCENGEPWIVLNLVWILIKNEQSLSVLTLEKK